MSTKNRIINKLLKIAKKHKVLTYPVLALVAFISVFSYFFSWTTGAGKRVVALVMVMVMLVSQSYFLTSSATELVDDAEAMNTQNELQMNSDLITTETEKNTEEKTTQPASSEASSENTDVEFDGTEMTTQTESTQTITSEAEIGDGSTVQNSNAVTEAASQMNENSFENPTDAEGTKKLKAGGGVSLENENNSSAVATKNEINYAICYVLNGSRTTATSGKVSSVEDYDESTAATAYTYDMSGITTGVLEANGPLYGTISDPALRPCYKFEGYYSDKNCTDKITDLSQVHMKNSEDISSNTLRLYVVCTLVKYRITVDAGLENSASAEYNVNGEAMTVDHYVDKQEDGSASFTITNIKSTGYNIVGGTVAGGTVTKVDGENSLNVTLQNSTSLNRTVKLQWTGVNYFIDYAKKTYGSEGADNNLESQELEYGADNNFWTDKDITLERKPGYVFKGWQIGAAGGEVAPGAALKAYHSILYNSVNPEQHTVLYPTYDYVGLEMMGGADDQSITFQYKTAADPVQLNAQYKYTGDREQDGSFEYTVEQSSIDALRETGITVQPVNGRNGGITISVPSDGPASVTDGTVELKFTVTDSNAPEQPAQPFTYKIQVNPKKLYLTVPEKQKEKIYDKSADAPKVTSPIDTVDENGKVSAAKVTFTGVAQYNDSNVATANTITLPDATITFPGGGEDPKNYVLASKDINGCSITKRIVFLKTETSVESVRTGEKTPTEKFSVALDDEVNSQGSMGLCEGDSLSTLGKIVYSTNRPEDLEVEGTYTISAATQDDSNYAIDFRNGVQATFDVIQEDPKLDVNYSIQAQVGEDGWYTGENGKIITVAGSGYDTVWISTDNGANFVKGGALKEEYSGNPDLAIKLTNSSTGAVTSVASLSLKYDISKPQYIGYTVDELSYQSGALPELEGKALYFPGIGGAFDFGTYVRSMITIRVQYESDTSGLDKLQYGLFGQDVDGKNEAAFDNTTGIATIKILKDAVKDADTKVGIIKCRAVDKAGNVSDTIVLKPTKDSSDSYEWSVETAGPSIEPLVIYSGEDQDVIVMDQSGVDEKDMAFYNHCQAQLKVTDEVSGIYSVTWHMNGTDVVDTVGDSLAKVTSKLFTKDIVAGNTNEPYTLSATVRDNAGNEVETKAITFKLDDVPPELVVDYDKHVWSKETKVTFTTSDALSGIYYARVTNADGETIDCDLGSPEDGLYTASFQATKKGRYSVEVSDKAGNVSRWSQDINMISTEAPECPAITFDPVEPDGKNGWYITKPDAVIQVADHTADNTPVESEYAIWKDGETSYNQTTLTKTVEKIPMTDEGIFHIQVWSKSASGIECIDYADHIADVRIDTEAPEIAFTTEKGSGSDIIVKFTIEDKASGVDKDSIKILHGDQSMTASVEENENGYSGSFEITETGNYTIQASDLAGNVADEAAFTPMSMKIKAITNISNSAATVGATIYKGTFDITSATISYRKIADETYIETDSVMNQDTDGNIALSTVLKDLSPATNYAYKITAASDAGEVLEYVGYFQTLADNPVNGIAVTGTVRYANDKTGTITLGLYAGNSCVMAQEIEAGSDFIFEHVPDGNYNLVATDGVYSKNVRVSIEDGMIIYPSQYIEIVLSGKNTSVYLTTPDTPNVSADNMDSIFTDDIVNFTDQDKALIDAGGTVEFQLCATLMTVSNVSTGEIAAMYAVTDKNKIVGAYLDLTLYKIVTDSSGNTEKKKVTDLANGAAISVTIPLGELAGKPDLEVIRIHNDGENFIGSSLVDQDNNVSTYTISTNQFSTYAVLYGTEKEVTTEATTQQDTQSVNNNTTSPNGNTTTVNTSVTTPNNNSTADDDKKPTKIKDQDKKPQASNQTSSIGSLKSSGTAKTGDASPIAILFGLLLVSVAGVFVFSKKLR